MKSFLAWVASITAITLLAAGTSFASDASLAPDPASEPAPPPGVYVKQFLPDVVGGTKRIFSEDNLPVAVIGTGLAGLALLEDHRVKDYFQDRKPLEHVAKIGDKIGLYYHVVVGAALWGTGELVDNKKLADTGDVTLQALLVTGVSTEILKYSFRRKRPNGGNNMSFPSGHASMTTAMAASISGMYDWDLRLTIPLYATAAFVGASRLQANEHYLSDVIAGMTLGTLVGASFAKYHKEKDASTSAQKLTFLPLYDRDMRGGLLVYRF